MIMYFVVEYYSWDEKDIHELQKLVKLILGISNGEFERIIMEGSPEELQYLVSNRTASLSDEQINEICNVLTKVGEEND